MYLCGDGVGGVWFSYLVVIGFDLFGCVGVYGGCCFGVGVVEYSGGSGGGFGYWLVLLFFGLYC